MRPSLLLAILTSAQLALLGCTAVLIESNDVGGSEAETAQTSESSDGDTDTGDTGDGDGDGDGDTDGGDGDDGDGDGDPSRFRVVVIADLHVPGPDYTGDDDSLLLARERLLETRDQIAAIEPPPAFVVVLGDLVHEAYGSDDLVWYQTNANAFAEVSEIFDGFGIPVYPLYGDSDYDVPTTPKTFSHQVFAQIFATDPYYTVDHLGWRFVFANSQYGQTYDKGTNIYDPALGSFGSTQLTWIGDQFSAGMPTVLLSHFPLYTLALDEAPNNGPYPDLETVLKADGESVALVLSGHDQQWTNLPATYAAPHIVFGSTRYDSDNFLLIEFTANALQYEILDLAKVGWGTQEAETWIYDGTPMPAG
ncbi:3',5'-cyclic adenosine monophosphate phosphodiesterase CpdA [Enhygromyxa salina]|uniref:3',5'-cyclic adenosine monophosphate phosphodiesterase CpdA n=1 Tax=Enhygromyxa salina TaxID=215803 RepID=A0A2S9XEK4_9BACT|nr:metallophosphoesterase [Enhygromyxa salina]PRP91277.1 3',5'-cyclic adenosine monophosphate phosphodiesterase CpdA [Enhygromyxa salina]